MQCSHFQYAAGDRRIAELGFGVAAMDLAALGCAVLPLRRGGKPPHEMLGATGGVHHTSNNPGQIRHWWGIEDMFANVGVRTGQLPFPGTQVVVADLDIKGLHDGPAIFRQFLEENGLSLPPGMPWHHSPTGGYHGWMGWPASWGPCPERQGILGGVDVKGDNGYVVTPPSYLRIYVDSHDGERGGEIPLGYEWESGCPCQLPWAPQWFAEWIRTAPTVTAGRPGGSAGSSADGIDAEKIIATGAEPGKRNTTYYKLACSRYRRHGTGPEGAAEVLAEVRAAWEAGDTAGMPWREVLTSVASARRFIQKQEQAERVLLAQWQAYISGGRRD